MKHILLTLALFLSFPFCKQGFLHAQGQDPVLAGMIIAYTDKAKKELKQQESMMLLETTGHIWIKEEVEGTTNLQKEFNNYLDEFRSIIAYAAQVYGFYHEIDKMINNLGSFSDQLRAHPSNAMAVALSSKMTEKERIAVILGIRPKLRLMNQKLRRLTRAIKYTSLADVWTEIDYNAREGADKLSVSRQCMERWKRNGKR